MKLKEWLDIHLMSAREFGVGAKIDPCRIRKMARGEILVKPSDANKIYEYTRGSVSYHEMARMNRAWYEKNKK